MTAAATETREPGLFAFYSRQFDIPATVANQQATQFAEVFSVNIPPGAEDGLVLVSGAVVEGTQIWNYAAIDVLVVGYAGGQRTVLKRDMVSTSNHVSTHPIEEVDAYERIAVEVRPIVDGGASGLNGQPTSMNGSVTIRLRENR